MVPDQASAVGIAQASWDSSVGGSLFELPQPVSEGELNRSVLLGRLIDFWQNTMSCFKGTAARGLGRLLDIKGLLENSIPMS